MILTRFFITFTMSTHSQTSLAEDSRGKFTMTSSGPGYTGDDSSVDVLLGGAIQVQSLLAQFYRAEVRFAYLGGSFLVEPYGEQMLDKLIILRDQILKYPILTNEASRPTGQMSPTRFIRDLLGSSSELLMDPSGRPLQAGWTYGRWREYLRLLGRSSFWQSPVAHPREESTDPPTQTLKLRPDQSEEIAYPRSTYPGSVSDFTRDDSCRRRCEELKRMVDWGEDEDFDRFDERGNLKGEFLGDESSKYHAHRDPTYGASREAMRYRERSPRRLYGRAPDCFSGAKSDFTEESRYHSRGRTVTRNRSSDSSLSSDSSGSHRRSVCSGPRRTYRRDRNSGSDYATLAGDHPPMPTQLDALGELVKSLSVRKEVVPPGKFVPADGHSLRSFLKTYEKFFDMKYTGSSREKANHLKTYLTGSALQAYMTMSGSHLRYPELKAKLLEWYQSDRVSRQRRAQETFRQARMASTETFVLYAMRIEELANVAFPDYRDRERHLYEKFRSTTSTEMRLILENQKTTLSMLSKEKLDWKKVKRIADAQDRCRRHRGRDGSDTVDPVGIYYVQPSEVVSSSQPTPVATGPSGDVRKENPAGYRPRPSFSNPASSGQASSRLSPNRSPQERFSQNRSSPQGRFSPQSRPRFHCSNCGKPGHTSGRCYLGRGCDNCGSLDHRLENCTSRYVVSKLDDNQSCPHCRSTAHLGLHCPSYRPKCPHCHGPHYGLRCTRPRQSGTASRPLNP